MNDEPSADDLKLTAYLDGELPPAERAALESRLSAEPALRARLDALRDGHDALQSAFAAALAQAPRRAMAQRLQGVAVARARPIWRLAAAIAMAAFLAGFAAARWFAAPDREDDWRQAVAEYMSLYTAASFPLQDPASLAEALSLVSQRLDVRVTAADLRQGEFAPRSAVLLQFDGKPLAQIGYVVDGEPVAFCIIRDGQSLAEQTISRIGRFNVVQWAKDGRGFMVISAAPPGRLARLAQELSQRVTALR